MRNRPKESEKGYALLMVFLMAAIIALMLYQQLPRVAFESEREKEQLLIDRGEQYTRAIQLYFLANNRQYPTSIEDLEKREKRFLRRRFLDPYTGKDEWRVVHTNGVFLTDSLVTKPPTAGDSQSQSASNTNSTTTSDQLPQVNAAVLQRPSDRPLTPPTGFVPPIEKDDGKQLNAPLPPITLQTQTGQQGQSTLPPITLQPGYQPGLPPISLGPAGLAGAPQIPNPIANQIPGQIPGQTPGQIRVGGGVISPFPGAPGPGGLPGGIQPNLPPGFQIDANGQIVQVPTLPGQAPGLGIPGQPQTVGQPVFGQAGLIPPGQSATAPGSPNAALSAINQILQTPRQNTTTPAASGGNQVGAIAGIASTHKGPSIKIYKDQTQYQMWEFVFSPTASVVPGGGTPTIRPGPDQTKR